MPKNRTISTVDQIDKAAQAHNASLDKPADPAEQAVQHALTVVMDAVEAQEKATSKAKGFVRSFILECALIGWTLTDIKSLCQADPSWPLEGGQAVGEKAARGTRAGDAYNSIQAVFRRLVVDANGVPVVQTDDETGLQALVTKGKDSKLAVARFADLETPPESQAVAAWQAIADSMTAEEWDIRRPLFAAVGCPVDHIVTLKAA